MTNNNNGHQIDLTQTQTFQNQITSPNVTITCSGARKTTTRNLKKNPPPAQNFVQYYPTQMLQQNVTQNTHQIPRQVPLNNHSDIGPIFLWENNLKIAEAKTEHAMTLLTGICTGNYHRVLSSIIKLEFIKSLINCELGRADYPLMIACEKGNFEIAKILLENGASPNVISRISLNTPLIVACNIGNEPIVRLLCENGVRQLTHQNSIGLNALLLAIMSKNLDICKLVASRMPIVLNYIPQCGKLPALEAIASGNHDILRLLLSRGYLPNQMNPFSQTLLQNAIYMKKIECVEALISFGADVNLYNPQTDPPLCIAAQLGENEIVKMLVASGKADVDIIGKTKTTTLSYAARFGNQEICNILLNAGANINPEIEGKIHTTPLYQACCNISNAEFIKFLLSKGARVNVNVNYLHSDVQTEEQKTEIWTPLEIAINSMKGVEIYKLLIDSGADVNPVESGKGPLYRAMEKGDEKAFKFLLGKGADPLRLMKDGGSVFYYSLAPSYFTFCKIIFDYLSNQDAKRISNTVFEGTTPLLTAIENDDLPHFHFLISKGADVNLSFQGETPIKKILELKRMPFVKPIFDSGAKISEEEMKIIKEANRELARYITTNEKTKAKGKKKRKGKKTEPEADFLETGKNEETKITEENPEEIKNTLEKLFDETREKVKDINTLFETKKRKIEDEETESDSE